jgi:hypothetical protein
MSYLLRTLHLLSLGLWLGAVTFFSFFTALPIITHMEKLATTPDNWAHFTTKAEGTRMAGEALTAVFERYFWFQAACGVAALLTSLAWLARPGLLNKLRPVVLAVALALALTNLLYLSPKVHELRQARYSADTAVAEAANAAFSAWHGISLLTDMTTLALVFVGMTFAAGLTPPSAAGSLSRAQSAAA